MSSSESKPDLVVLSDLHLCEGIVEPPARYSPMEDFFYDDAFARLLDSLHARYAERPEDLRLILNGDVFDFLSVTVLPSREEALRRGIRLEPSEDRFGLEPSSAKSVYKLDVIMDGHPAFFAALARFVAQGHQVELLRGNHDLELYYRDVRTRLRDRLCKYDGGPTPEQVRRLLRVHQWFYLEPGRVYIEHGNQYEASNSIRYPLRPVVRSARRRRERRLLDYPLGSLFVRFFYNRVHRSDPYTPKVISFEQYLEFLRRYNLMDTLRIARDHYPFFVTALRPAVTAGSSRPSLREDERQQATFRALEAATLPPGLHAKLDRLKVHPMAASKLALAQEMMGPIFKRFLRVTALGLGSVYMWFLIFSLIQATPWLAENVFGKAWLMALLSVGTVGTLFWLGNGMLTRMRRRTDETVEMCAQRAAEIAELAQVRLVLMGHTHVADLRTLCEGRAVYANSGTWAAVEDPWSALVPQSRRFSFLYVRGDAVEVSRWNDEAGRIEPVPFFDLGLERAREVCRSDAAPAPVPAPRRSRPTLRSKLEFFLRTRQ